MTERENIQISLSNDEALVLYDFLVRFNEKDHKEIFEDQSEQRVLWNIECELEKQLVEPLKPDYIDLLKQARDKIRD